MYSAGKQITVEANAADMNDGVTGTCNTLPDGKFSIHTKSCRCVEKQYNTTIFIKLYLETMLSFFVSYLENNSKQEYIPVECVPPAALAVSDVGVSAQGGVCLGVSN